VRPPCCTPSLTTPCPGRHRTCRYAEPKSRIFFSRVHI
jgi:hypothetical protein